MRYIFELLISVVEVSRFCNTEEDPESGERKFLSVILAGGLLNRTGPITDKSRERYFCDSQLVNSARKTRNQIFADEESTKRLRERKREEHHDR